MIGYLNGTVKFIFDDNCIVDVHGVGYRVYIDSRTLESLNKGQEIELFIHTAVREDSITLYGFKSQTDYELFAQLITVSGIGARTALNILAKMSSKDLAMAIWQKNVTALTNLPGIGKKSAQRLILELKDKISTNSMVDDDSEWMQSDEKGNPLEEASEALSALGYTSAEIAEVFSKAKKSMSTEELVKFALKELNRFGK
ncbi:MAG: Holliday junction branch migration protein RuvA [Selenomonadaceae bacterium]|nr:Holliday junction branch migration protein RuvA [Selenomonadaceae bacterium]